MKLQDLYKKSVEQDGRTFEVIKSDGTMSGNHITLVDPFSAKAAKLTHMFDHMVGARMKEFEKTNVDLLESCKEAGDYTDYNLSLESSCQDLRDAFACELVESWDFDDELTPENIKTAVEYFRFPLIFSLERQVINAFKNVSTTHAKK